MTRRTEFAEKQLLLSRTARSGRACVQRFNLSRLLVLGVISCTQFPATTLAEQLRLQCRVPGQTIQWELDHCLLLARSDNPHTPLVRACMDLVPKNAIKEDCKRNLLLKRYRCLVLNQQGYFTEGLENCLDSTTTVGPTLRQAQAADAAQAQ